MPTLLRGLFGPQQLNTDTQEYMDQGVAGVQFVLMRGTTDYHTVLDSPRRLGRGSLQMNGDYAVGLARGIGDERLARRTGDRSTYFNVTGGVIVQYGPAVAMLLALVAAGLFGGSLAVGLRRHTLTVRGLVAGALAFPAIALLSTVASCFAWLLAQAVGARPARLQPGHRPERVLRLRPARARARGLRRAVPAAAAPGAHGEPGARRAGVVGRAVGGLRAGEPRRRVPVDVAGARGARRRAVAAHRDASGTVAVGGRDRRARGRARRGLRPGDADPHAAGDPSRRPGTARPRPARAVRRAGRRAARSRACDRGCPAVAGARSARWPVPVGAATLAVLLLAVGIVRLGYDERYPRPDFIGYVLRRRHRPRGVRGRRPRLLDARPAARREASRHRARPVLDGRRLARRRPPRSTSPRPS